MKNRSRGEVSTFEIILWLLAACVALLLLSAPNTEQKKSDGLGRLETAVAQAPEGCYVGLSLSESTETVAMFLNKHTEFEFVSEGYGRLLLKRKGCDNEMLRDRGRQ